MESGEWSGEAQDAIFQYEQQEFLDAPGNQMVFAIENPKGDEN